METTDAIELIEATETRVVEEREYKAGVLTDLSYNYFAISTVTHSVFYFGEDEATIVNGTAVAPKRRGWRAGENGASFGLIMPGTPLLGARYQQENAPGNTMDRAECVGVTQTVTVKAGTFTNCLLMEESDGMDPEGDTELKAYAPGVGLVRARFLIRLMMCSPSLLRSLCSWERMTISLSHTALTCRSPRLDERGGKQPDLQHITLYTNNEERRCWLATGE